MFRSRLMFALVGTVLLTASAAFAEDISSKMVSQAKCLTPPKGYLQTALGIRLENDLTAAGLLKPKVRVKFQQLSQTPADPSFINLTDLYKDTFLTVTPVQCVTTPCNTPPTITFPANTAAVINGCTVAYKIVVKYAYHLATNPAGGASVDTKVTGSAEGQITVGGTMAPVGKKH